MSNTEHIIKRIAKKRSDYKQYDFDRREDNAFKAFFDLAQELDSSTDFYSLCVAIPKVFFEHDASIYLTHAESKLKLVDSTLSVPLNSPPPMVPEDVTGVSAEGSLLIKIRGKKYLIDQLPFKTSDDVIGLIEIHNGNDLNEERRFFFLKYANRIGFNLHNRFLVEKNIKHLKFVRSLVADIEHNIIAPNVVYKLFMKNISISVTRMDALMKMLKDIDCKPDCPTDDCGKIHSEIVSIKHSISDELDEMQKHHHHMSMFLESLLRRSHFEQGRLTLRTKPCNMNKDVVLPQVERFFDRFHTMGIELDQQSSGVPEEEMVSVVDIGLMSQVYANLFSNVLKYAEAVDTPYGRRKYISYGYHVVPDFFGPGRRGLKYNVFSTGRHVDSTESVRLFDDRFRGSNSEGRPGTGHGLSFIKNVVEIHGGVVGYEPTSFGNNFYFIVPADEIDR